MKKGHNIIFAHSHKSAVLASVCFLFCLSVTQPGYAQQTLPVDTREADELFTAAEFLVEEAKYDSASTLLKRAAELFREAGNWERAAESFNLLASNYRVLSKLDSTAAYSNRSLDLLNSLDITAPELQARAYNNLALVETERNNFLEAIELYEDALEIAEPASLPAETMAMLLGNLGSVYDDQGNYDQALEYYTEGISLLDGKGQKEQKEQLAKLYNYIGVTHVKKGLFEKALQFYEQELEINIELHGRAHPAIAGGYNNIGGIYYRIGDIGEAIIYFKKAADATEQIFGDMHPRVGLIYNNIGAAYYETGDYKQAIEYMEKSAEIKRQSQGSNHPDLALTYNNIGSIYTEMKRYDTAIGYLQQSLDIRKKVLGVEHPVLSNNYNSLGLLYLNTGDIENAIGLFQKGLDITIRSRGVAHPYAAEARTNLAKAYREQDNFAEALNQLNRAEEDLRDDTHPAGEMSNSELHLSYRHPKYAVDILYEKAKTLYRRYRDTEEQDTEMLARARQVYTRLSDLLDAIQFSFRNEESKLLTGSRSHRISEDAIRTSYALYEATGREKYLEDIFFFSEKSKARVILELLNNRRARKFAGIPDSLVAYENELRSKLTDMQQALSSSVSGSSSEATKNKTKVLQDSLFALNRNLNAHLEYLKKEYSKYHDFKYRSDILTMTEVRNKYLSSGKGTVLEYFYGEESSWAIVINPDNIQVVKLPHIAELPGKIAAFNEAISRKQDSVYVKMAYHFYESLIKPVEAYINSPEVQVIPDGPLNLLPFDALIARDISRPNSFSNLPYLLNTYTFSYTPSISLSAYLDVQKRKDYPQQLLAYAPVFSDPFSGPAQRVGDREGWESLPSTKYEVEEIAKAMNAQRSFWSYLTGSGSSTVLTEAEATESSFKKGAPGNYRYLHLATHAFTSDSRTGRTGVAFHPEETGDEDGMLYAEEIYGLQLNNELVVLSACETGTGEVRAGEGIIGLSRAFQYAGAQNLMVSLWNVEDRSTARLMISFYERLQNGSDAPGALQSAKQVLIDTLTYAHPRYWAPFVFIGS